MFVVDEIALKDAMVVFKLIDGAQEALSELERLLDGLFIVGFVLKFEE